MGKMIGKFIDGTTMYRLLIYYLGGLLVIAGIVSGFGGLGFSPIALAISVAILLGASWLINRILARIFAVSTNHESSIITALILALLITPKLDIYDLLFLVAAAGLAMASKYILTIRGVHIFNPAALAVVLTALGPQQDASWWVGTGALLPFVLIGGVFVVWKIRRTQMVVSFLVTTFLATALFTAFGHGNVVAALQQTAFASPAFFLGFVMLTEPLTSPGTKGKQTLFAILVGLLLPPQVHFGGFYTSPELSLVIGNIFAYIIDRRVRIFPRLTQKVRIATKSVDFVFRSDKKLTYQPGQYMEWTLPHERIDDRGNRRYFTLASSPTEAELRLGIKFHEPSSSYKKALMAMTKRTPIIAAQVAGDFVMPRDTERKLAFIANGIGITPFRSMTKYLLDKNEQRDVTILYAVNDAADIAYRDVLEQARTELKIPTTYVLAHPDAAQSLSQNQRRGRIDSALIRAVIPDFEERIFYISGSHRLVVTIRAALRELGVENRHIKVDYFPGY